jgi:GNAT superfamily N-acetyltransferase
MPMIDVSEIARLEESRVATAFREIAPESRPLAGGVMARSGPGSWTNCVVGAGFDGPMTDRDVAEIVEYYSSAGIEPRVEVCPLADPSLPVVLAKAGFVLRAFESVLFRTVSPDDPMTPPYPAPPGLDIQVVDQRDDAAVREYVLAAMSGFIAPGEAFPEHALRDAEAAARHPRSVPFAARLPHEAGNRIVAAGGLELFGELAALYGLSVQEPFRRRGIQLAMLAHRLRVAAQRGARYATIGSRPGAHTERNVRRMGFELAYTKVILVKPGPGLAPVVG